MSKVRVIHDWDFALYKRSTCFKKAVWLLGYCLFGKLAFFRKHVPNPILQEKLSNLKTILTIDKLFNVYPLVGITNDVLATFPEITDILEKAGVDVRYHYHIKKKGLGKGRWIPDLYVKPENMIYDRRCVLQGNASLPEKGDVVVWHADHPYNLFAYIEFLQRCKSAGLLDGGESE